MAADQVRHGVSLFRHDAEMLTIAPPVGHRFFRLANP